MNTPWGPPEAVAPETAVDDHNDPKPPALPAILLAVLAIWLGVTNPWLLLAIGALLIMIFLHELGHYMAAKRGGMKVTEFFLGFGPRIFSFRRGETEFGLKAIPLGAYVKVIGMNNLDTNVDPAEESRTYRQASYPRRLLMASAGSLMHFTLAFVLGAAALVGYGELRADSWKVADVEAGTPAATIGLRAGDRITSLNGSPVGDYQAFRSALRAKPGQTVTLGIQRDGVVTSTPVQLLSACNGTIGRLGIASGFVPVSRNIFEAVGGSASTLVRGIGSSAVGIGKLFSPGGISSYVDTVANKPSSSTGPVACTSGGVENRPSSIIGITQGVSDAARNGLNDFLLLFVGVNIAIGVFNLLPMLPFDGGHVVIATYERLRERRGKRYHADVAKLLPVVYGLVGVLLILMLSAGYLDVTRGVN